MERLLWAGALCAFAAGAVLLAVALVDPRGAVSYNTGWLVMLIGGVLFYASSSLDAGDR